MTDHPLPLPGVDRRAFLRTGAIGGLGLLVSPPASADEGAEPRVRRYVKLGDTGLRVPDIGFGASRLDGDEAVVRHALERGITHFDSAEGYAGGASETTLGRALASDRERVTLVSKVKCGASTRADELMRRLEASLQRLRTDRVEIYLNHAVNDLDRLRNEAWYEFVARAKEQGKIRFAGISGHGGNLAECLEYVVDRDLIDVALVAHNFGQDPAFYQQFLRNFDFVAVQPDLPRVLLKARAKGIGIFAMKTLRGGRLNDLRPYESGGATFAQAALRWVLAGPYVDALVVTMKSPATVDEYLGASGYGAPTAAGLHLLERYEAAQGTTQCRYGCRACTASCGAGVEIPEVLRVRMYAEDYGDAALAREEYARLGRAAEVCLSCAERSCLGACPFGLPIAELTARAHRTATQA
jgi:predicted aldo/keto reductase-like oxidoreductase